MKEKKEKNLKKIQEEKILEVVNRYKLLICHQIKSGKIVLIKKLYYLILVHHIILFGSLVVKILYLMKKEKF